MIGDIVHRYRARGLHGRELRAALQRHARILAGADHADSVALMARAGGIPVPPPKPGAPREEWAAYDRLLGIGDQ
jgi:hypothetical protein